MPVLYCKEKYDRAQVQLLSYEEVSSIFKFEYMPGPLLSESFWGCMNYITRDNLANLREARATFTVLNNPEETIVIHKICNTMGYGLVTTQALQDNTVILEVTGDIGRLCDLEKDHVYMILLDGGPYHNSSWMSAKNKGNLARFACHLPNKQPSNVSVKVELANLSLERIPGPDRRSHLFLITKKTIQPGAELGWDYGEEYDFGPSGPVFINLETRKFIRRMMPASHSANNKLYEEVKQDNSTVVGREKPRDANEAANAQGAPQSCDCNDRSGAESSVLNDNSGDNAKTSNGINLEQNRAAYTKQAITNNKDRDANPGISGQTQPLGEFLIKKFIADCPDAGQNEISDGFVQSISERLRTLIAHHKVEGIAITAEEVIKQELEDYNNQCLELSKEDLDCVVERSDSMHKNLEEPNDIYFDHAIIGSPLDPSNPVVAAMLGLVIS
jgi:hypothetical protein